MNSTLLNQKKLSRDIACELIDFGFAVFPLVHGDKVPRKGSHGYKDATTSLDRARRFPTKCNVGIAPGHELFVIDVDSDAGQSSLLDFQERHGLSPLPTTVTVATGRGHHMYFKTPKGMVVKSLQEFLPDVDIKGHDGYAVAPGSLHENGRLYRWLMSPQQTDMKVLPDDWAHAFVNHHRGIPFSWTDTNPRFTHPPTLSIPPVVSVGSVVPVVSKSSSLRSVLNETEVKTLVAPYVLTEPRSRNRKTFELAQAVRAHYPTDANEDDLETVFEHWWEPSEEFSNTDYDVAFSEFLRAFHGVHSPKGDSLVDLAWAQSENLEPPELPNGRKLRGRPARIAALCMQIDIMNGGKPFPLGGETVARLMGNEFTARYGWDILAALCRRRVLKLVDSGRDLPRLPGGRHPANVYRFTA